MRTIIKYKKIYVFFTVIIIALNFSYESKSSQKNRQTTSLLSDESTSKTKHKNSIKILTWNIQELGQTKNKDEILTQLENKTS